MNFFIPNIDEDKYEEFYNKHRNRFITNSYSIANKKIHGIKYFQGDKENRIFIGDDLWDTNDKVYLILFDEIREMYIILTPRYGFYNGNHATIGKRTVHMLKEYLFH